MIQAYLSGVKPNLKSFVDSMENTSSDLEKTIREISEKADETIDKFTKAQSSSQRDEHPKSLVDLKEKVLDTLRKIKQTEEMLEEVETLKKRAQKTLQPTGPSSAEPEEPDRSDSDLPSIASQDLRGDYSRPPSIPSEDLDGGHS